MPDPGDRIGAYLLVERLGAGRFGEVWTASPAKGRASDPVASDAQSHDEQSNDEARRVVIKIAYEGRRDALQREVAALSRLQSVYVPAPLAVDLIAELPFAVFPFVAGRSMRERLVERGPFPPDECLKLVTQVLRALAAAHRLGVVHCDVKPDNILITDDRSARLLDFGICAWVAPDLPPGKPPPEAVGGIAGSPAYLAPEVRFGELIRPAADVYAVGVVLFELLTGRLPRGNELPSDADDHLPVWADKLYARCCADYESRFTDASITLDVVEVIQEAIDENAPTAAAMDGDDGSPLPRPMAASPRPILPTQSGRLPMPKELLQMRLPDPEPES